MSQVKFAGTRKGGEKVAVVGGWDRPLREFFLTIFVADSEDEEIVWSDLLAPSKLKQEDTHYLRGKLTEYGIEAPEGFWDRVERREANVVHVRHEKGWQTL